jgi:L-alanine-DL-glutamate epimerase-like enolase superfamily enzyme
MSRAVPAPPVSFAMDLLMWAFSAPPDPGATAVPVRHYASALGVHDAKAVMQLADAFAAGFPTVKVDLLPQMTNSYRRAVGDMGRYGGVAVDAQARFASVTGAVAVLPERVGQWLEDPCPPRNFSIGDAPRAPLPILVGETSASTEELRRWARVPNVTIHLEVACLGLSTTVALLEWLEERSLTCRLHGRMPLLSASVVIGTEIHLAWVSERLGTMAAFERSGQDGERFLKAVRPVLDMAPAQSASVLYVRPLGGWRAP